MHKITAQLLFLLITCIIALACNAAPAICAPLEPYFPRMTVPMPQYTPTPLQQLRPIPTIPDSILHSAPLPVPSAPTVSDSGTDNDRTSPNNRPKEEIESTPIHIDEPATAPASPVVTEPPSVIAVPVANSSNSKMFWIFVIGGVVVAAYVIGRRSNQPGRSGR